MHRLTEADLTERNASKFWSLVKRRKADQCWLWHGSPAPRGYGRMHIGGYGGRDILAHRIAYFLTYREELSSDDVIRHRCDNPGCCNPNHLLRGSQQDNLQDMRNRGRARYGISCGVSNGSAKLNATAVDKIRRDPGTVREIAKSYGISKSQVSNIKRRKNWNAAWLES